MSSTVDSVLAQQQNELLDSLQSNTTLVTLVGLVPGLLDLLLSQAGSVTILAPTEEAFANVSPVVTDFLTDPANVETLKTVLQYHVIKSNNNLLGESFPASIQIDTVLIPPSLQSAVNDLVNSAPVVPQVIPVPMVQMMGAGGHGFPSWMVAKKPNNNWS